jgi:hypothetical protein
VRPEVALAARAVALAGVLADPGERRLADNLLAERLLQQRFDVADRQAPQNPTMINASSACVRATPLPST